MEIFIRIFLFINLEDPRTLEVIFYNTVMHNCYKSFSISMDTGGLETNRESDRMWQFLSPL